MKLLVILNDGDKKREKSFHFGTLSRKIRDIISGLNKIGQTIGKKSGS
jgi:hypothetical protein